MVAVALGATRVLTGCSSCGQVESQPYALSPTVGGVVATEDGANAVVFATWRRSSGTPCGGDVFVPALHPVSGNEAENLGFTAVRWPVRVGNLYVAVGRSGDYPALYSAPLDDPGAVEVKPLPDTVQALVVAAGRAFYTLAGRSTVGIVGTTSSLTLASPTQLAANGDRLLVALEAGGVVEVDAITLASIRSVDSCVARSIAPFGSDAVVVACGEGVEIRDLASNAVVTLATNETVVRVFGAPDRAAALAVVDGDTPRVVLVKGTGFLGAGASWDPYYGAPASGPVFAGTSALIAIAGSGIRRFSLASGESEPIAAPLTAEALTRAGDRVIAAGRLAPSRVPALVRFDLETGEMEELIELRPPPEYFRW